MRRRANPAQTIGDRIRAIETAYAGCRFRSRLEARWAVFFDALGIPWEYEPEGYALPSGPYLPDFKLHLSAGAVWFEVKPPPADEGAGDERWPELAEATGVSLYVVGGMARFDDKGLEYPEIEVHYGEGGWDHCQYFCACARCGAKDLAFEGRVGRICGCDDKREWGSEDYPRLAEAYRRALSARFEHGEHGAMP